MKQYLQSHEEKFKSFVNMNLQISATNAIIQPAEGFGITPDTKIDVVMVDMARSGLRNIP